MREYNRIACSQREKDSIEKKKRHFSGRWDRRQNSVSWRDADGGASLISSLKISPMALVGDARVGPPIGKKREQRRLSGIHLPLLDSCTVEKRRDTLAWQRISSNSASAATVHQQHQRISGISTSAASAHQRHQRICSISASAASATPAHQQHQRISNISASAASAHQQHQHHRICSNITLAATVHWQHQRFSSISAAAAASTHQQHQRISSNSASAATLHQRIMSISYMRWKGYLPIYINQFRSYQPIYIDTTRHASDTTRHHQTPPDMLQTPPDTTRHAPDNI